MFEWIFWFISWEKKICKKCYVMFFGFLIVDYLKWKNYIFINEFD